MGFENCEQFLLMLGDKGMHRIQIAIEESLTGVFETARRLFCVHSCEI